MMPAHRPEAKATLAGGALVIGHWTLVIHWSLELGHWSFVRSSPSIHKHKLIAVENQPAQVGQAVLAGVGGEVARFFVGRRAIQGKLIGGGDLRVEPLTHPADAFGEMLA